MKRKIYRKWYNDCTENYLLIYPSGIMLQITFKLEDPFGKEVTIYKSNKFNRLNPEVFKKHKEMSTKAEFDSARRTAIELTKLD